MKRYKAQMYVTSYYDVFIDADNFDDAWDIAEELSVEEIVKGDFRGEEICTIYVDEEEE